MHFPYYQSLSEGSGCMSPCVNADLVCSRHSSYINYIMSLFASVNYRVSFLFFVERVFACVNEGIVGTRQTKESQ